MKLKVTVLQDESQGEPRFQLRGLGDMASKSWARAVEHAGQDSVYHKAKFPKTACASTVRPAENVITIVVKKQEHRAAWA